MENFVAVKPAIDFSILLMKRIGDYVDSVSNLKEDSPEFDEYIHSIADSFQPLFMQEALLFDKIYLVKQDFDVDNRAVENRYDVLVRELVESSGGIFSFIDSTDILSNLKVDKANGSRTDFLKSLASLLDAFLKENVNESEKTRMEFERKWRKIDAALEFSKDLKTGRVVKPRSFRWSIDKVKEMGDETGEVIHLVEKFFVENIYPTEAFFARLQALELEYFENLVATPLLPYTSYLQRFPNTKRQDIAQLVIRDIPLPEPNTPWEAIVDYRNDPDNRRDLLGLRRWIRQLSTEELSLAECAQELEWLQSEFQAHLRLHKIKTNAGTLEVMIKAPLEVLENIVTLKFSKLVDPLFVIQKRRIALMEAELNAPGREIAYLVKAKESFER